MHAKRMQGVLPQLVYQGTVIRAKSAIICQDLNGCRLVAKHGVRVDPLKTKTLGTDMDINTIPY